MIDGKLGLEADELGGGIRDDAWEVYPPGGRVTVVRCRCSAGCMGGFGMGSANSSGVRCAAMMGGGISGRVAYRETKSTPHLTPNLTSKVANRRAESIR